MNKISVIVCTHNPREELLKRTLVSINRQSLDRHEWELLVIDNKSDHNLADRFDISWHPNGRHVREDSLGLTYARLRGIREATGELLVFVDDDNVLAVDYLQRAWEINKTYSFLGAWGGSCNAEYEVPPPSWFSEFEGNIAVRKVEEIAWSNQYFDYRATPIGAGMCMRKSVANKYCSQLATDVQSQNLDRKGDSLMSCGDHDMAWTSMALGLGVGVFPSLTLTHIIPEFRIREEYLLKLLEADACSSTILRAKLQGWNPQSEDGIKIKFITSVARLIKKSVFPKTKSLQEKIHSVKNQGFLRAYQILREDRNSVK